MGSDHEMANQGKIAERIRRPAEPLGRKCYRYAQRLFSSRNTPKHHINLCVDLADAIRAHGRRPAGATVMEVGMGPYLNMPIIIYAGLDQSG